MLHLVKEVALLLMVGPCRKKDARLDMILGANAVILMHTSAHTTQMKFQKKMKLSSSFQQK